jgi:hypothetical protein
VQGCSIVRIAHNLTTSSSNQSPGHHCGRHHSGSLLAAIDSAFEVVKSSSFVLLTSEDIIFPSRGSFLYEVIYLSQAMLKLLFKVKHVMTYFFTAKACFSFFSSGS